MENHPIPQDVTGFQFKLIGNMTVKQFAYVAVGVVLSVIVYYLPILFIIKIPFIILFAGVGVSLAFLPIDGRPMDVMLTQFLHALIYPNQYIYAKEGVDLSFSFPVHTIKKQNNTIHKQDDRKRKRALANLLSHTPHAKQKSTLDDKESSFLTSLFSDSTQSPNQLSAQTSVTGVGSDTTSAGPSVVIPITPIAYPDEKPKEAPQITHDPEKIEAILKQEAEKARIAMEQAELAESAPGISAQASDEAHQRFLVLQQQLSEITTQQKAVEEEMKHMQQARAALPAQETYVPQADTQTNDEHVKKITQLNARSKGILHPPDSPNVIVGVVQDPRGNMLRQILVEIRDQDGSPVRAFKTNELGQFASATPLSNGRYTILCEDPQGKQRFDTIDLECNGQILPPIEVISHDDREELRRALFS